MLEEAESGIASGCFLAWQAINYSKYHHHRSAYTLFSVGTTLANTYIIKVTALRFR